jgi:Uma2 family endonuclease
MSTVPNRRTPAAASDRKIKSKTQGESGRASFDYGWRYVEKKGPDGRIDFAMVPLTLEDVLHPQYGDVHVLSKPHNIDCEYLHSVSAARLADDPGAVVLADTGVYWDDPKLKHHSPDIAVILGVKKQKDWESFYVAVEGVRPLLIVEVTSPRTRSNDLNEKVDQYAKAGVPHYVIADAEEGKGKRRRLKLLAYRLEGSDYRQVPPDPQGRVMLEPLGLLLGVTVNEQTGGDRLALFDPLTGREIGDYTAISRRLEAAEAEARAARKQAQAAKKQAETARKRATAERERAKSEAQARADAEARAAVEATARSRAEERLRQAEAELRRLRSAGEKPQRSKRSAKPRN